MFYQYVLLAYQESYYEESIISLWFCLLIPILYRFKFKYIYIYY